MRVATFNIHHGTVGKQGPVDPDRLGEVCAGFGADVIALEEVDLGTYRGHRADLAAAAARACGMVHVFGPSRRFPGGWYGNALLVRGDLESWSVTGLPKVPSWRLWQERRTVLQAAVRVDGQPWSIAATHLAVPQGVNGPQLDRVLDLVADRPRPLVVLGDLNRFPSTVEPAARAAGLAYVPHGPTNPVPHRRLVIDHVLVSPDVRVGAVEVRSTPMSDHAALLVDLEVSGLPVEERRPERS
ncbi:endonuclease/exonuclease/phosphatase family protein [Aquihabitans sp. G128]|uniref:endonuclease/exonuclease/phosphatase family protein n=1 Tax=Aquihabitans sp. G128 TaxID=2849779 RepID=UPI001C229AAF|nr:endonuclease/exonuclease/phosphatase family protein [Aquihabitans sp. G128]QXC59847.1 endonuclease/exonuclease/phosphatase family protein [Aquihabitans sp. G128]